MGYFIVLVGWSIRWEMVLVFLCNVVMENCVLVCVCVFYRVWLWRGGVRCF